MEKDDPQIDDLSQLSEERKYVVVRPRPGEELVLTHRVSDCLEDEGVIKRTETTIVPATCCGILCSYDGPHRPPGGICPTCHSLLCAKHSEKTSRCRECHCAICYVCEREKELCSSCYEKIP